MADTNLSSVLSNINQTFKEEDIVRRAAEAQLPYVNLLNMSINADWLKQIPYDQSQSLKVICFAKTGGKLKLATTDPHQPNLTAFLQDLTNRRQEYQLHLASEESIDQALSQYALFLKTNVVETTNTVDEENLDSYLNIVQNLQDIEIQAEKISSPELLNLLNVTAVKTGASDIHLQPDEHKVAIRMRIDGILNTLGYLTPATFRELTTEIKYRAKLILNVSSHPQDGKYRFKINDRQVDVRVSTIPTTFGESFVMRILDQKGRNLNLTEMGFVDTDRVKIETAIGKPNGIILLTGPTGSGKTTTLYTILHDLNQPERKIITLEDPIEYHLNGITQSQTSDKDHYDFASGLKAILRHDPDVIMVGEIRDLETAEIAAQAALTGHLVLSTLHTNSAVESINRLQNLGLPTYMIAPSLEAIIGQRLIRVLCTKCRQPRAATTEEQELLQQLKTKLPADHPLQQLSPTATLYTPGQCAECSQTGYHGRTVITEVMLVTPAVRALIEKNTSPADILNHLRTQEHYRTMFENGLIKVWEGHTTIQEVRRQAEA